MNRIRILDWILLLACCAFFFLWQLSSFGLIGADEPRYAQVAREMLERHDWVTPTLGGVPWLEKPPLYYWQAIIAFRIFGVSDWAARLPSVFDASVLVLSVYWFLRRFRPGFALDGGLMLVSCAGMVGFARAASTDMPLAAAFSIAMLAWFAWFERGSRGWLAGAYVFLALATLAKGPVAPLLALVIVGIFAVTQRSWRIVWGSLWPPGVLLFFLAGLPWYVLVQMRNPQFFRVFILEHNFARFGTNMFHHPEPFWYYLPVGLLAWLPWAVFVIVAVAVAIRRLRAGDADTLNSFLLIWIATVIILFSISRSKLPGYILPATPAGILLLANYLRERYASRMNPLLIVVHAAACGSLVFAALLLRYIVLQQHFVWDSAAIVPAVAAGIFALLIAIFIFKAGVRALRVGTLAAAVITVAIALRFGAPALMQTLSARAVSDALAAVSPKAMPVAAAFISRETEFGLQFYRNQPVPRYEWGQMPSSEHLVVARQGSESMLARKAEGRKVVFLGNFPQQKLEFFYVSSK